MTDALGSTCTLTYRSGSGDWRGWYTTASTTIINAITGPPCFGTTATAGAILNMRFECSNLNVGWCRKNTSGSVNYPCTCCTSVSGVDNYTLSCGDSGCNASCIGGNVSSDNISPTYNCSVPSLSGTFAGTSNPIIGAWVLTE